MAVTEAAAWPAWSSPDDETLSLILSLSREDAKEVASISKGKQAAGSLSDAEFALQLYAQELDRAATYLSDRIMTRSICFALQADVNALLESERLERVAENDRRIAIDLSAGRLDDGCMAAGTGPAVTNSKPNITRVHETGSQIDGQPESSSWAASRKPEISERRPCAACGETRHFVDLAKAPCEHEYCSECLKNLFQNAMSDESLFPPRCCRQAIPIDPNRLFLGGDLVQQFKKKAVEFSTPNRTYCHQPACSAFIPPSAIKNGVARCPNCTAETCTTCKKVRHEGDCPADAELKRVLLIARQKKWQRCKSCSNMVESTGGCFQIT
ncbi:hypothetical protein F4861DRAFT_515432 [Xylaria intraflava]|nr:hypothetical protein F4861DRAFT_515432 [Xylaria intraflava]